MPQSSLSTWLESRLRRNGKKVFENTSLKSLNCGAVNVKQEAGDKEVAVSIAFAKVGSVAARGVLNAVKVEAGAPTTTRMAKCMVGYISGCINSLAAATVRAARSIRDETEGTAHPTQVGLPIAMNLRPVATAVSLCSHDIDVRLRKIGDRMNKARRTPHDMACFAACMAAIAELKHAFIDVVEAHIASIAAPTTMSVPSLEKLVLAVAATATESARGVADAVIYMEKIPPPPYEDPK